MAKKALFPLMVGLLISYSHPSANAQQARIVETNQIIPTYPFSDPSPVPLLLTKPKVYPYFQFDGYSHHKQEQSWKVVSLENELIEVSVLPEVGGKVWGAIEKSTGQEFIYRNEVMKFRNIALRGPWTSGGIEFNFGIIGHTPACATPVDYLLEEHEDGSVSCIVGNLDLPSRTQWRVRIRLPKDKAYFETEALWYNPTPLTQSYYNWITATAAARASLEFFCPGNQYLQHDGQVMSWPFDAEGRRLSQYRENDFGPSKSYHVVGEHNDFFGGYYQDTDFGFGHWSPYEDMPGQKLWLWAQSRAGGIWEDLLTDTDGQYIEFQAGRLLNQFFPGNHANPITQAFFPPHTTDQWRELWFPVKEINGLTDVSPSGILHVTVDDGNLFIGVNALEKTDATLKVAARGKPLLEKQFKLEPMGVLKEKLTIDSPEGLEVQVDQMGLFYRFQDTSRLLKRPFQTSNLVKISETEQLFVEGQEKLKYREYTVAREKFQQCLSLDPGNQRALVGMAELSFRSGLYQKGLEYADQALELDTYHPSANFIAGNLYRVSGDLTNAKESLGWAARSMEYRSAAYAQKAEIGLIEKDWKTAEHYAHKSLDYNRHNINALQVLVVSSRQTGNQEKVEQNIQRLLQIDPLNHFARFERSLQKNNREGQTGFQSIITNELPYQSYLELAISYYNIGQLDAARAVLELAPQQALVALWKSFLLTKQNHATSEERLEEAFNRSPAFVFPFRRETEEVLRWALNQTGHWKAKYYLALNLWAMDRKVEAVKLMRECGQEPDYPTFYTSRAFLAEAEKGIDPGDDLAKAHQLDTDDWRNWHNLSHYYQQKGEYISGVKLSGKAFRKLPENYTLGMDYVKSLIHTGNYEKSIEVLSNLKVLPFEGAAEGRLLYERAYTGKAIELIQGAQYKMAVKYLLQGKEWPENLGVGRPYEPEERLQDYLLSYCYHQLGDQKLKEKFTNKVIEYTHAHLGSNHLNLVLGLEAMKRMETEETAQKWWLDNIKGNTPDLRWIFAIGTGNEKEAQKIERTNPDLFDNQEVKLLKLAIAFQW